MKEFASVAIWYDKSGVDAHFLIFLAFARVGEAEQIE